MAARNEMKFTVKGCVAKSYTAYHKKDGVMTRVLLVSGILTQPLAELMKIEACFDERGIPVHGWANYPGPDLVIASALVKLGPGFEETSNLIHKIKISQDKRGGETDPSLTVTFRMHFGSKSTASEWFDQQGQAEFAMTAKGPQETFSFGPVAEEAESGEVEERVEDSEVYKKLAAAGKEKIKAIRDKKVN